MKSLDSPVSYVILNDAINPGTLVQKTRSSPREKKDSNSVFYLHQEKGPKNVFLPTLTLIFRLSLEPNRLVPTA